MNIHEERVKTYLVTTTKNVYSQAGLLCQTVNVREIIRQTLYIP